MNRSLLFVLALTPFAASAVGVPTPWSGMLPSLVGTAEAAEYDGEIKRYTVKVRRKSTDYRLRVVTVADDEAGVQVRAGSLNAELTATGDGPEISAALRRGPQRAQVRFGLGADEYSVGAKSAQLEFQIPEKVVMEKEEYFPGLTQGGGWVEVVHDSGLKARLRVSEAGDLTVVVLNEDRDWDPSELSGVSISSVADDGASTAVPLDYEQTRHVWVYDLDAGEKDPTGHGYRTELSLMDADGVVLDGLTDTMLVDDDAVDPGMSTIRIGETGKGVVRLVTWTWSEASEGATLESALTDSATGEDLIVTVDDSPVEVLRNYSQDVVFEKPPEGYSYGAVVTLLDAEGYGLAKYETKLEVPKVSEDTTEITGVLFAEDEGLIAIVPSDADLYTVHVQYTGEIVAKIAGVQVELTSASGGPVPKESTLGLIMDDEWRKWVQKGAGALTEGADAELSLVLTDADGTVLDEIHATADAGKAYDDGTGPDEVDVFIASLAGGSGGSARTARKRLIIRR